MPSSWSPSLRFELQFTGENINLWGDKLNAVLTRADTAIAGWLNKTVIGDFALTTANAAADEARNAMVKLVGAPPAGFSMAIPAVSKQYVIWNATNRAATVTTGASTAVEIDPDDIVQIVCDGSAVKQLGYGGFGLKDYITAFAASAGAVPSPIANAGKFLYSDGANVMWRRPSTSDLSDYESAIVQAQIANATAMAIALGRRR